MTSGSAGRMLAWLYNKGFFHLLSVNFVVKFLSLVLVVLLARLLTAVEIGQVRLLQIYLGLFGILAACGYSSSVLLFCAEAREESEAAGILRTSVERSTVSTALAIALMAAASIAGLVTPSPSMRLWLMVSAAAIPFGVWSTTLITYLQARQRIADMARSQAVVRVQGFVLIAGATWLWGFKGYVFSSIAAAIVGLAPLFRFVGWRFLIAPRNRPPVHFTRVAFLSALSNGLNTLAGTADLILIDHLVKDRAAVGYYSLATLFVLAGDQFTGTVQAIVTPHLSARRNEEAWFRRQIRDNQRRMIALALPVAVGSYGGAAVLVRWLYGPSYAPTLSYLPILLAKYVLVAAYSILSPALFALGRVDCNLGVMAVTTPIAWALGLFLIPRYGMYGAAWGQVIVAAANWGLMLVVSRHVLAGHFRAAAPVAVPAVE